MGFMGHCPHLVPYWMDIAVLTGKRANSFRIYTMMSGFFTYNFVVLYISLIIVIYDTLVVRKNPKY